jgi:outer membrane immunogenic protein
MFSKLGWALAAAVSFAGIGAASAADMAVKARPMPVPVYSWTGCYIGLSAGAKGVQTRDTAVFPAFAAVPASSLNIGDLEDITWIGGGQVGCNYQTGNWVFGIEGDAHAQKWGVSSTLVGPAVLPPFFAFGDRFELHSDWQASARGRVGYAQDRALFYVTGGAAFTEVRSYTSWAATAVPLVLARAALVATDDRTLTGWTIGAGVEWAATNNITLGLEGRYSDYGTQRFNSGVVTTLVGGGVAAPTTVVSQTYRDVRIETGEVMAKVNYKFGGPVVAKY